MKLDSALRSISILAAVATLSATGCARDESEKPVDMQDEGGMLAPNSKAFNGWELNGLQLNGLTFNGTSLDGLSMTGVQYHAQASSASAYLQLQLQGAELIAPLSSGTVLGGTDLQGMLLSGELSNGDAVPLRIDGVTPTADSEIYDYDVSFWDGSAWAALCVGSDGRPVAALALDGRWDESSGTPTGGAHIDDPSLFTFACKNASLAKCVDAGYAPWRSLDEQLGADVQSVSMRDMHQACTRMLRADYCGDGTPHTQNGTLVNEWDNFDVQVPDEELAVTWTREAEWSSGGAVCVLTTRWGSLADDYIDDHCPERRTSPSFGCFQSDSTFFTDQGFSTPLGERSLIRNAFTHDTP